MKKLKPFQVPTGDGKKIFEHFGFASAHHGDFSLAHMIAPAGWSEDAQVPDFDEYVVVLRGELCVECDGQKVIVGPGESIVAPKNRKVRYSNPFAIDAEYVALCLPAFRPDRVRRESQAEGTNVNELSAIPSR